MPDQTPAPQAPTDSKPVVTEPTAETLDLSKFFGPPVDAAVSGPPGTVPAPEQKPADAAPAPEAPKEEPKTAPEPAAEAKNEIAEALNEWRAERKVAESAKQEAQSWRQKYEEAVGELEAVKSSSSFEDDPLGYIHSRKMAPERVAEIVQLLAYDLNPTAAPQDFRWKIHEAKMAREKAEAKRQAEEAQMQAQAREGVQKLQAFISGLDAATQAFPAGQYPANEDWYGENRKAYVSDLYSLANELAEEAASRGERADVSAGTLAAKLEKQNAEKLAALEQRRSKRSPKAVQEPEQKPADVMQNVGSPASTQGLNQGGPRPPALTDEERIRRATAVAFGGR